MAVGNFGSMVFSVSRKKVKSFSNFERSVSGEWKEHSVYKGKSISEFVGPGSQQITFDMHLNASLGVSPLTELEKWEKICEKGKHDVLVIGKKQIGSSEWKVEKISESWNEIWRYGELIAADISVTMSEYISTDSSSSYQIAKISSTATSKTSSKQSKSNSASSVAVGGTYTIKTQLTGYYTSMEAKNLQATNRTGKVYPGKYYVYNKANGMINVTKVKGNPGSWINPSKNK